MAAVMDLRAVEALEADILDQARARARALEDEARAEAGRILDEARARAAREREAAQAAARASAERERERTLAAVPLEVARMRAERLSAALERVKAEASARLEAACEAAGRREVAAALAADALRRMEGRSFVVTLAPRDLQGPGGALCEDLARRAGRGPLELSFEAGPETESGALVRDAEGRRRWDNRLPARLERLWPRLRERVLAGAGLCEEDAP